MLHRFTQITFAALLGGAVVANYGTAFAQDGDMDMDGDMDSGDMDGDSDMDSGDMDGGDMDSEPESTESGDSSASESMDDSAGGWPLAMRDRPLTLMKGMFSAGAALDFNNDFSAIGLGLGGLWGISYGVTDELSVGLSYNISLKESSDFKGPVALRAGYTFYAEGPLILTGTASAGVDLAQPEGSSLTLGTAGVMYWYNMGDKLSIFGGGDQLSVLMASVEAAGATADFTIITMDLPVAVGYQLDDKTFLAGDINLGNLVLSDGDTGLESTFIGADQFQIGATATYSPNNTLDAFLNISTDLKNEPGDTLAFLIGATYYGGGN